MPERRAWDRQEGETSKAYEAFRHYRDLGPLRRLDEVVGGHQRTVERWSTRYGWSARAVAWDDEVHMRADQERLESIRRMHDTHQRAARVATGKALAALQATAPEDIPPAAAARLLDLGTRLERATLLASVEDLQGVSVVGDALGDPWQRIADELQGTSE